MTRAQREQHKQLLLLKGELLRMQLTLEAERWRQPAQLLREGASLFGTATGGGLLGSALLLLRHGRLRRWLKWLLAILGLWRLLRR
ncbi:hypothetical protein ACFSQE_02440 [Vogesella fluminis]|uniref:YqjK-like protein n=1 Tax=Vogesella fluminis TaxID=1069161 RepID=A0ABQ3H9I4_9NEIS|nr:hypothetical protein [Vogesella fluminis]GHD77459.1 hypothetical protein GCM10011419_18180 [Vogesella fluminis]